MLNMILNVIRAVFGFASGVVAPATIQGAHRVNGWARIAIVAIVVLFFLLPASLFGFGVAGWQTAIPWIAAGPLFAIFALVVWQPATLLAFFAPWGGVGGRVRASTAFALLCGILLAFIAGWVPWGARAGWVPWFLLGVYGYAMSFMAPNNAFVRRARQALLIGLVAMMAGTCYHAGWFKDGEELVDKVKNLLTSQASPICYENGCQLARRTGGDGIRSLTYHVSHLPGTDIYYEGDTSLVREDGLCRGTFDVRSTGASVAGVSHGVRLAGEILPVVCDTLEKFESVATMKLQNGEMFSQRFFFRKEG